MLDALGDPTRRRIFELVAEKPRSVAETASRLPVSRPAVSQHLKVLKRAGLVKDRAVGPRRIYALETESARALYAYLDRFWGNALERFRTAAELAARDLPTHPKE